MGKYLYVMLMTNHNKLKAEIVEKHVDHLKTLELTGRLILCGPFSDFPGGIVIFRADSLEEAHSIAQSDPFIKEGYKTYELRTMEWANKENGYLL